VVAALLSVWMVVGWDAEPTVTIVSNASSVMFAAFATVCAARRPYTPAGVGGSPG
jgi:hypothetical protein